MVVDRLDELAGQCVEFAPGLVWALKVAADVDR
jgi:hypothetical protein